MSVALHDAMSVALHDAMSAGVVHAKENPMPHAYCGVRPDLYRKALVRESRIARARIERVLSSLPDFHHTIDLDMLPPVQFKTKTRGRIDKKRLKKGHR